MKRLAKLAMIIPSLLIATVAFRAFIGSEYIEGDHEIGSGWAWFIKRHPTFRYEFRNPAEQNLELIPFDQLTPDRQAKVRDYCKIRFGLKDIAACYARMAARMI